MSSPELVHSVPSWESLEEVCHQAVFLSACRLSLPPKPLFHIHSLALFFRKRCSPLPQFPTEVQPAPCLCSQAYWPPQRNNSSFLDLPSCKALTSPPSLHNPSLSTQYSCRVPQLPHEDHLKGRHLLAQALPPQLSQQIVCVFMNSVSTQPQSVRGPLQTLSTFLTPNSQQRWHPPLGHTPSQPCPDSCPCPFSMQEPSCLSSGSLQMSLVPPSLLCLLCHYQ